MPSANFLNLEESVKRLKRVYLNDGNFSAIPNSDDQESARAFVVFVHAELEEYVENIFRDLANKAMQGVAVGHFSRVAISLLAFSGIPALNGGGRLTKLTPGGTKATGTGKKEKNPRLLVTRYGEAHGRYTVMLDNNNGVNEKYLAAMGIPIGLDAQRVDVNWINDLETFCSSRGKWAHMSRTNPLGKHGEIDPSDIWKICERLIWSNLSLAAPGVISSFEGLDDWVETEKSLIGSSLIRESRWRFKIFYAFSMLWRFWGRRSVRGADED
ncbi:hypothetical protein LGN30_21870 [Burkholderia seminalis]|uniref:hypothetical protein n=1 Tax=Burkholderia seminalis TaxID=488731 RepID=UPI001CF53D9C|nr:hypothetical protein [Burkholderia seminalis]MCA8425839.1 hypothetical protein [Burkholderia seminalis]